MTLGTFLRGGLAAAALTATGLFGASAAQAQGALVVYCGVQEEWCRPMAETFEKETGVKVAMTRKSAGEFYAQLKAEASNPRGDIWWGGTGDPHLQSAEEGLTLEYRSPKMAEMQDWAVRQWESSKQRTIGIYSGALGFSYNTQQMAKKAGGGDPKCWADLADPRYKDDIQVADPNSSGTSYAMVATMVQLLGENPAFDYLKKLHKNINQYTKSGAAPVQAAASGETLIGITFQHDAVVFVAKGAPLKIVSPCEGTGYEIGSMSIVKGARNLDNAKKFYDWALSVDAQMIGPNAKVSYQVPSNKNAKSPPGSPDFSAIKFINYDFAKYGSSAVRTALLSRWDKEVKDAPK